MQRLRNKQTKRSKKPSSTGMIKVGMHVKVFCQANGIMRPCKVIGTTSSGTHMVLYSDDPPSEEAIDFTQVSWTKDKNCGLLYYSPFAEVNTESLAAQAVPSPGASSTETPEGSTVDNEGRLSIVQGRVVPLRHRLEAGMEGVNNFLGEMLAEVPSMKASKSVKGGLEADFKYGLRVVKHLQNKMNKALDEAGEDKLD